MSVFGWSLPPGCGELPGEAAEYDTNEFFEGAFPEADGLEALAKILRYKNGAFLKAVAVDFWKDEGADQGLVIGAKRLRELGSWEEMDKRAELVTAFFVQVDDEKFMRRIDVDQSNEEAHAFRQKLMAIRSKKITA